jgi:outer membrane receptor protein involved in Fe transport
VEVHDQGQGPGFASDASVRGFSSDHSTDLALWVDGVPINEPVNGHAEGYSDWSLLFPQSVEDVEVIKGPASPLFGNFALAGVVNVRTLERMDGTKAWLSGGSWGRGEAVLLTGLDRPRTGAVVGVRGQRDGGWRPHGAWGLGQGYARLVRDLSSSASLDLGVNLYGSDWDSPGFLTTEEFARRDYDLVSNPADLGSKRRAQERASLRVVLGPALVWRTTLYSTQGRWTLYLTTPPEGGQTEGSGSQTEERDRRWGVGLTSALTWHLPRVEVTVGTQDRSETAKYGNWFTTARVRDSTEALLSAGQLSGSAFLQTVSDVGRHVRLSASGRWDVIQDRSAPDVSAGADAGPRISAAKSVFSPKLGVLWHMPWLASLYASVSRGFRDPDGVISEPDLPFITEWAYEAGIKLDAPWGAATLSAFRMDVSNEQTFNPIMLSTTSGGASRRKGVELEALLRPHPWITLATDVTVYDARYLAFVTEDGGTLSGAPIFNTARWVGSGSVAVAPPSGRWDLRLASTGLGPYTPFDEPGVVLPAYALVQLSGGVMLAGIRLDLGVRNLLDKVYPELRAGGFVTPGQPRALYLNLSRAFGGLGRSGTAN